MERREKEQIVAELTDRLRVAESLIVADYRGLGTKDLEGLRRSLAEGGARFAIVKNTLTRRAAEAAGADALLALLEGPTAIAFFETDGDPVAVAKALRETARTTRVLTVRGGLLEGRPIDAEEIERLATLPGLDQLRADALAAIIAPLNAVVALINTPLRDLVGLIDARIEQLGGADAPASEPDASPPEAEEGADEAEGGAAARSDAEAAAPADGDAPAEPQAAETETATDGAAEPAAETTEPEAEAATTEEE